MTLPDTRRGPPATNNAIGIVFDTRLVEACSPDEGGSPYVDYYVGPWDLDIVVEGYSCTVHRFESDVEAKICLIKLKHRILLAVCSEIDRFSAKELLVPGCPTANPGGLYSKIYPEQPEGKQ